MKEHLEYCTAEDIDGLIDDISDLNRRLEKLADEIMNDREDASLLATLKRSYRRLSDKRENLLRALNDALSYLR